MKTPEVVASVTVCLPAVLLAACNDFRVKNELKDPYEVSLTVKDKNHVNFTCEESYLTQLSTKTEISKKIDEFAESSCGGNYIVAKNKIKSLTINPGEYYQKVSASFRCEGRLKSDFEISAAELCRSLFGPSYRLLSAREN